VFIRGKLPERDRLRAVGHYNGKSLIIILCLQEITFLFSWQNNKMQNISQVTFHNIYELAKSQIAWKGIK
jgi:hypothetical protein